jgi:acetaldehyde dehydrogenase (acetylating)
MFIAEKAGFTVPAGTRCLIAPLTGVGRDYPLSIEKLCPVLSYYVVKDWREGCERCKEILRYGGMGHTMSIHSRNDAVILEFGLHKPAFRICVNTPTTHGSIGLTTGLDPAMTLGCGGFGGNITSDNITPRHLLNIKRVAYELRPAVPSAGADPERVGTAAGSAPAIPGPDRRLPQAPPAPGPTGIGADLLTRRVDQFLRARGFSTASSVAPAPPPPAAQAPPSAAETPAIFVCEDDVRQALRSNRRISVTERTIITPAARDLGEAHGIFATPGVTRA